MPNVQKCRACRNSKKACLRDGQVWNDQDNPQTRCDLCNTKDLSCGPKQYKHENDPEEPDGISSVETKSGAADIQAVQLVASAPNPSDKANIEAEMRRRLYELGNSEMFHLTRQRISLGPPCQTIDDFIVPQELCQALEDIVTLADLAHSKDISYAEVAYNRVIDWYMALGPEVQQPKQQLLMKVGHIYEEIGSKDLAELCYSKIFEDLPEEEQDVNTPFHHGIRKFNMNELGRDALMGIIRCCPLCRFRLRNREGLTPLSLAVSTGEEQVACAILERLRDRRPQSRIGSVHLDALDFGGKSILTGAILSKCSFDFISKLIEEGANVNPEVWDPNGPATPLRAASRPGCERVDVALLLIRHAADLRYVCCNSSVADLIANGRVPASLHGPLFSELDTPTDMQNGPWIR